MKKLIYFVLIIFIFTSCEYEIVKFGEEQYNVAFSAPEAEISETSADTLMIPVVLARTDDGKSVTVTVTVDTESSTAVENQDFKIISSSTLTFSQGCGIEYLEITAIDNNQFTGDKILVLEIGDVSVDLAANTATTATVTFVDDEHPLKAFLGTYTVSTSSGYDGVADYSFDITTTTDPVDNTKLWVTGWYSDAYGLTIGGSFYVVVDVDAGTVTIPLNQTLDSGYGLSELGSDSGLKEAVGTIKEDNSIDFTSFDDYFTITITEGANAGIVFDYYYNMYWTKK